MEKTTIRANYIVACELMDSLYTLYMAIVEGMGGNPNDPNIRKEGENYARKKFLELADEFENALPMQWAWVSDEEDEE
jgi:hypothetical protein